MATVRETLLLELFEHSYRESCVEVCPEVYEMEYDKAQVKEHPITSEDEAACRSAAEQCPATAISIKEYLKQVALPIFPIIMAVSSVLLSGYTSFLPGYSSRGQ